MQEWNQVCEELFRLVERVRPNVRARSRLGRAIRRMDAVDMDQWTWGLGKMMWEAWMELGEAGQRKALAGWHLAPDAPSVEGLLAQLGTNVDTCVDQVLAATAFRCGRVVLGPDFIFGHGSIAPVQVRIRAGTDKITALRAIRQAVRALERNWESAVDMGGREFVLVNKCGRVLEALRRAPFRPTKKPQTFTPRTPQLGGGKSPKAMKAAA